MKLGDEHYRPPPCHAVSICRGQCISKDQEAAGIEGAQDGPDNELGVLEAGEGDKGLADAREEDSTDKSTGDNTGEGEVVVGGGQAVVDVGDGSGVDKDVMDSLEVEGLLDFGVGGDEEVDERDNEEERAQLNVCRGPVDC